MEINMTYAIIGTGLVGATLARFFAAKIIPVLIANSRAPETLGELTVELGTSVKAVTVDERLRIGSRLKFDAAIFGERPDLTRGRHSRSVLRPTRNNVPIRGGR
jgi:hypothetical protein